MARVEAASNPLEMAKIDRAIVELAKTGRLFTADDVRSLAGQFSRPNLIGSRFHNARRMGIITSHGVAKSYRRSRRSATVYQWRGTTPLLPKSGLTKEEALARDKQITAIEKILGALDDFNRKERAAILDYVIERVGLGPKGAAIDAEEKKAKAAPAPDPE